MNVNGLQQSPQRSSPLDQISPSKLYAKINAKVNLILESSPQKIYRLLAVACKASYGKKRAGHTRDITISLHTLKGASPLTIQLSNLYGNNFELIIRTIYEKEALALGASEQKTRELVDFAIEKFYNKDPIIQDQHRQVINSVNDLFFSEVRYIIQNNQKNIILALMCEIQKILNNQNSIKDGKEKGIEKEKELEKEKDSLETIFQHDPIEFHNIEKILEDEVSRKHTLALITLLCDDFYQKTKLSPEEHNPMVIACALYIAICYVDELSFYQIDLLKLTPLKKSGKQFMEGVLVFLQTIDWKITYSNQEIEERLSNLSEHPIYNSIMPKLS